MNYKCFGHNIQKFQI